eukprot:5141817-Ditylum_brightwellii.AAC.1
MNGHDVSVNYIYIKDFNLTEKGLQSRTKVLALEGGRQCHFLHGRNDRMLLQDCTVHCMSSDKKSHGLTCQEVWLSLQKICNVMPTL